MKKIFIIAAVLSFALLQACKKDKLVTVGDITAPVITSPADGTAIAVTIADSSQLLNVNWKSATYGVSAVVNYFVQVGVDGASFKTYTTLASLTEKNTFSISYNNLNNELISGLNLAPNSTTNLQLRVGSAIYGKDTAYSAPVKIAFTSLQLNQLWLPGSYQGYSPSTAPTIQGLTTPTQYEGYTYFSSAGNFKFTSAPDYNHINYGDGGNGKLTTDGNAGGIVYANAGEYLLDADIQALTYSVVYIQTMGIIGTATAGLWNSSTPMTVGSKPGTWTIKTALTAGALKFRANDGWDVNYGPGDASALTGTLIFNDPGSINITTAGTYTITIDMTKSASKTYTYTVTQD